MEEIKTKKLNEAPNGEVAFEHEGIKYLGNEEGITKLFQNHLIGVGVTPNRKRIDVVAGFRNYHVPSTVPHSLAGPYDGKMKVLEISCPNSYEFSHIDHSDKSKIKIISKTNDEEYYSTILDIQKIMVLGRNKEKRRICLENTIKEGV